MSIREPISCITVKGASEHNLKSLDVVIERGAITVITGVSGSGKSSLAFDTLLAEAQRRFFYTLSHYSRQFLDLGSRPAVKSVNGLSPAIALSQNETQPSRKASVGTLTDVAELIGVLYARFGEKACPKHGLPTAALTVEQIARAILADADGQTVAICAPLVEQKKGHFAAQLTKFAERGYTRALIDGELVSLTPTPELAREEKHTISILIDQVKVKPQSEARLIRSLKAAVEETSGFGEYYLATADGGMALTTRRRFSSAQGCPQCGYSWPQLDSRYFSANSLGRCESCQGYGELGLEDVVDDAEVESELDRADQICQSCQGTGLSAEYRAITLGGEPIHALHLMSIERLGAFLAALRREGALATNPAFTRVAEEVVGHLGRIEAVGLGYLNLARRVRTLSGGEAQRLRLAGVLGENLRGVLYILDEPSQGLHPSELEHIWASLEKLKKLGNTVVLVDHDETLMRKADWIIDLGPGGGAKGGELMAKFRPSEAADHADVSLTARHLIRKDRLVVARHRVAHRKDTDFITITKPRLHNLSMDEVRIPRNALTVVTGVSGAGKSSLILTTLFENVQAALQDAKEGKKRRKNAARYAEALTGIEGFENAWLVDRRPIAKSSVSMPATYLDVFTELRNFYASLPEAQIAGLTARSFSLTVSGGRCEECNGKGQINLSMRFLADARVKCPLCNGERYHPNVLAVKFGGLSLADVLELTLDEVREHFRTFRRITKKLEPACDLGLGYLKIGQPSSSLSGGESQRLKLVPLITKKHGAASLIVMDEPTTGLHFEDVGRLMRQLGHLVDQGATVVLIEHNLDVAMAADWLIDVGPGAAASGGQLVYQGLPAGILKAEGSVTRRYWTPLAEAPRRGAKARGVDASV